MGFLVQDQTGLIPDFTESIQDIIIKYVADNWTLTTPAMDRTNADKNKVNIGTFLYDDNRNYYLYFHIFGDTYRADGFGDIWYDVTTNLSIDITVRKSGRTEPIELTNIKREIIRIIAQYNANPYQIPGIESIDFDSPTTTEVVIEYPVEKARREGKGETWRRQIRLLVNYRMQRT